MRPISDALIPHQQHDKEQVYRFGKKQGQDRTNKRGASKGVLS
jgi:hypothetical protein